MSAATAAEAPRGELEFETSTTTAKLDEALAKAQAELEGAEKDKLNPHFNSRYADLASVWRACRSALSKHAIAVTQWPVHSTDGRLHIITRLACQGEWMRAHFSVPVGKADAHGYGSATTYAKRYALSAAVGVAADDDDDGNAASAKAPSRAQTSSKAQTRTQQLKAELGAKAGAGLVAIGFGTHKGKSADSLTVLELTDAIAEGRTALERDPNAKWVPKLKANIEMLQRALDARMEPSDEEKAEIQAQEGAL